VWFADDSYVRIITGDGLQDFGHDDISVLGRSIRLDDLKFVLPHPNFSPSPKSGLLATSLINRRSSFRASTIYSNEKVMSYLRKASGDGTALGLYPTPDGQDVADYDFAEICFPRSRTTYGWNLNHG